MARAVAAALDGRGPATALTPMLLAAGVPSPTTDAGPVDGPAFTASAPHDRARERSLLPEIVRRVYSLRPVQLAQYAPLAFEATALAHDAVAESIVARAGHALAATLAAVVSPDLDGPLVVGGSVLVNQAALRDIVSAVGAGRRQGVAGDATRRRPVVVVPDGLVGAAVLSLRNAGILVDAAVFDTVTRSLGQLR